MSFLSAAFNAGPSDWAEAVTNLKDLRLSQSLLGPVTYEDTVFAHVDFSGSTVRDSYFIRCTFEACTFAESSFERVTLYRSTFSDCTGDEFTLHSCSLEHLNFIKCVFTHLVAESCSKLDVIALRDSTLSSVSIIDSASVGVTIKSTSLTFFRSTGCGSTSIRLVDVHDTEISIQNISGSISLLNSEVSAFVSSDWQQAVLIMKNSALP